MGDYGQVLVLSWEWDQQFSFVCRSMSGLVLFLYFNIWPLLSVSFSKLMDVTQNIAHRNSGNVTKNNNWVRNIGNRKWFFFISCFHFFWTCVSTFSALPIIICHFNFDTKLCLRYVLDIITMLRIMSSQDLTLK